MRDTGIATRDRHAIASRFGVQIDSDQHAPDVVAGLERRPVTAERAHTDRRGGTADGQDYHLARANRPRGMCDRQRLGRDQREEEEDSGDCRW